MYKLYFLRTTTGEVGSVIDAPASSWSVTLNKTETLTATVMKSQLRKQDPIWYEPYSGGMLLTFTDVYGYERPIVAGPITDWGGETLDTLELSGEGIRAIFAKRTVGKNLSFTGMSLGEIAWRLCEEGMDKPGGKLPITHRQPYEKADHQRTYERWNLANNMVDKRLTEISEVEGGPDLMFRPEWVDDTHTRIRWVFVHGNDTVPYIPQDRDPDFDLTAKMGDTSEASLTSSGADLTTRVWVTGSGEGEGVVREYAEDLSKLNHSLPFLEIVESDSDQSDRKELQKKARGYLLAYSKMIDQLSLSVDMNSKKNPLGTYYVGDTAKVNIGDYWLSIPAGLKDMRLIKMSGSLGSNTVKLEFQENSW